MYILLLLFLLSFKEGVTSFLCFINEETESKWLRDNRDQRACKLHSEYGKTICLALDKCMHEDQGHRE